MTQQTYTTQKAAIVGARRAMIKAGIDAPLSQVHFKVTEHMSDLMQAGTASGVTCWTWEPIDLTPAPQAPKPQPAAPAAQPQKGTTVAEKQSDGVAMPAEFGDTKVSKNRQPLVLALAAKMNDYVPLSELVETVYGAGSYPASRGKFTLVMKGLQKDTIAKNKLPVSIKSKKDGRNVSYGLFAKG